MTIAPTCMEWRICPRFPDYEISECGDMRRRSDISINQPGRRLRGIIDCDGYLTYSVRGEEGKSHIPAHVAVAEAFIGPRPSPGHEVAHNNGSRLNNVPSNLRWATRQENSDDRFIHHTGPTGMRNPRAKLSDDDVRYIRRKYPEIKLNRGRVADLDERFGISRGQVIRIARGQAWSHVQ